MSEFRFKQFTVRNELSAMKVNTDGVLLAASVPLKTRPRYILDVGTGTGSIALIIAQRLCAQQKDFELTGIDIDGPSALEAAQNFAASPWAERLTAVHTSLLDFASEDSWDLIVSNPPYYASDLQAPDLRRNAARHASVCAEGGNSLSYAELVDYASEHLSESGRLALILPAEMQRDLLRYAGAALLFPERMLYVRTTARKKPSRIIVTFVSGRCQLIEEELVILENGAYSESYRTLTGDFYL